MKIKKLLVVILLIPFITGWKAKVDLEIDDSSVKETITIDYPFTTNTPKEKADFYFRKYMPTSYNNIIVYEDDDIKRGNISYYNQNKIENEYGYIITYQHTFSISEYNNSYIAKNAFKSFEILSFIDDKNTARTEIESEPLYGISLLSNRDGIIYFSKYDYLNEITINIKSNLEVLDNNANKVYNGIYTWNFTPNVKQNVYILLNTKKESKQVIDDNQSNENEYMNDNTINDDYTDNKTIKEKKKNNDFIIIGIIVLIMLILVGVALKIKGSLEE